MKVVIPGGSGQIGTILARAFHSDGNEVVVLSRKPVELPWRVVAWDGRTIAAWSDELDGADDIINLAGRSVNCRYTTANRRAIMESRVDSTRVVGEAIARARRPPPLWLQTSTATIYAHRYDIANDEDNGILGGNEARAPDTWRFSIDVAKAWERALDEAATPHTRKVKLRSAMTMSPDRGGVFDVLSGLVRRHLGGTIGDGSQFVSWVHDEDFARAIRWLIAHEEIEGPVNVTAPNPVPNAEFMRVLREAWGVHFGMPATKWLLEIGAVFLRTETELVLKSRRVVPGRLTRAGFAFHYPDWPEAAKDLCRRWREASERASSVLQKTKMPSGSAPSSSRSEGTVSERD